VLQLLRFATFPRTRKKKAGFPRTRNPCINLTAFDQIRIYLDKLGPDKHIGRSVLNRVLPRSQLAISNWLKQCTSRVRKGGDDLTGLIGPLIPRVAQTSLAWQETVDEEIRTKAEQRTAADQYRQVMKNLAQVAGHARKKVIYRARRESFSPGLSLEFGLQFARPAYACSPDWLEIAATLIRADEVAASEGQARMAQPNAMELRKLLTQAEASLARSDTANHALYKAQEQRRQVRTEVTDLILDVAAYLRYVLRGKPKPEQHRHMRGFGFYFTGCATAVEERAEPSEPDLVPPQSQEPEATEEILEPEQKGQKPLPTRQGMHRNGFFASMIDRVQNLRPRAFSRQNPTLADAYLPVRQDPTHKPRDTSPRRGGTLRLAPNDYKPPDTRHSSRPGT